MRRLNAEADPIEPRLDESFETPSRDRVGVRLNRYFDVAVETERRSHEVKDALQLLRSQGRRGSSAEIDRIERSAKTFTRGMQPNLAFERFQVGGGTLRSVDLQVKRTKVATGQAEGDVNVETTRHA